MLGTQLWMLVWLNRWETWLIVRSADCWGWWSSRLWPRRLCREIIGLDYFVQPVFALDRISLHNAFFPETRLKVIGFGKTKDNNFQILVEQPFIIGVGAKETEITGFVEQLGFKLINPLVSQPNTIVFPSEMHNLNTVKDSPQKSFRNICPSQKNAVTLHPQTITMLFY